MTLAIRDRILPDIDDDEDFDEEYEDTDQDLEDLDEPASDERSCRQGFLS